MFTQPIADAALLALAAEGGSETVASPLLDLVPLIPALPLAGFAFTALFGRRLARHAHLLPLATVIVSFGAFVPELTTDASVIALMVMAVAAAEATVGLAIVMAIYRNRRTPLVDEYDAMRQ